MIRGRINDSDNQRTYATVITAIIGFILTFLSHVFPFSYPLNMALGLTVSHVMGLALLYVSIALYKKWL